VVERDNGDGHQQQTTPDNNRQQQTTTSFSLKKQTAITLPTLHGGQAEVDAATEVYELWQS